MIIIFIALAAFLSTLIGGLIALRFKDKLHLILGFSAGAVIGVALFDLLPEAIQLGAGTYSVSTVTSMVAAGFILYLILDRLIFLHGHIDHADHDGEIHESEGQKSRGILGAGSLAFHSFLDGVAIGLAFQVSSAIGAIVAIAVLVHDFSDGINTVGLIMRNDGSRAFALKWLAVDAMAPILGAVSTLFFSLNSSILSLILAVFAGFFLYIGASDLIPESQHAHPKFLTTAMTIAGVAVLYIAISFANL